MSLEVFVAEKSKPLTFKEYSFFLEHIDLEKKKQIIKYTSENNADNSLIGIILAKISIFKTKHIPISKIEIFYDEYGKPYVLNNPQIHISISHSDELIGCAISDSPVGLDIENLRKYNHKIYTKLSDSTGICTDNEFTRLWTEREAILKLKGSGLNDLSSEIKHCDYNLNTIKYKSYFITTAQKK